MAAGVYASQSILAALFARESTGRGQRVDVSLLDSLMAYQVVPLSMYLERAVAPKVGQRGSVRGTQRGLPHQPTAT